MSLPDFQHEIFFSRWEFAARHNFARRMRRRRRLASCSLTATARLPLSHAPPCVILLPAEVFASELGEVPPDRFRLGAGRRDPGPALQALAGFLDRSEGRRPVPSPVRAAVAFRARRSGHSGQSIEHQADGDGDVEARALSNHGYLDATVGARDQFVRDPGFAVLHSYGTRRASYDRTVAIVGRTRRVRRVP